MRAAIVVGIGAPLAIEQRPDPEPATGQVLVEVARCGICGSDLHMIDDERYGRRPGDVMGHEYAGRVVATGRGVEQVAVGDHVAIIPFRSCGNCAQCRVGEPAWCETMMLEGGGYAELAVTREHQCLRLPRSASFADGALIEPVAVALHALDVAGDVTGKRILVVGAGPIGLALLWWTRRAGAATTAVSDLSAERCRRATQLAATTIEPSDGPASERRYDIVFDCTGARGVLARAITQARPRGTVVLAGLCTQPDSFVPFEAVRKELRILTSVFFAARDFELAFDALCRDPRLVEALLTSTVSLEALPDKFDDLRYGRSHDCKVQIAPGGSA